MRTIAHFTRTAVAAAALALTGTAMAAETNRPLGVEASIPFVNHGGIADWRADGRDGLYIQDQHHNWYHASLMGFCTDLPYAQAVGFRTWGGDRLDRFSAIQVGGQRCQIQSLVTSAPPPVKAHKG
ncbi:hypothetical protein SAMN02927924_03604 [Sphingobium faniae]|nr:hypothetical protein SAMN02927924_03604 [Sphingobium faniae]